MRSGSSCMRENAGASTRCTGPRDLGHRLEHHVVGDGVGAERGDAEEAADDEPVGVLVHVVQQAVTDEEGGEAAEVAQARASRSAGADATSTRATAARWSTTAVASCWPMIAHAPAPATASDDRGDGAGERARRRRAISVCLKAISRSSSDCCVEPSAVIRKLAREHGEQRLRPRARRRARRPAPERATPSTVNSAPLPTVIQNAVLRSSSVSFLRCTSAAPKREVREHQHEAGEDQREHRQAVLLGSEQAGDDDRTDGPGDLQHDLGCAHPSEAAGNAATHVSGRGHPNVTVRGLAALVPGQRSSVGRRVARACG